MLIEPGFIHPEKILGYGEDSNGPNLLSGPYAWDSHGGSEASPQDLVPKSNLLRRTYLILETCHTVAGSRVRGLDV